MAGDVGAVAQLVPLHWRDGLDVLAVHQDIAIAHGAQQGDELHGETHLRRPETLEVGTPEEMAGDVQPALQVRGAVGLGNQRQHRMVVAGAEDLEEILVLQLPEQGAAVHDPVDPLLKGWVGEGLQQGARQG